MIKRRRFVPFVLLLAVTALLMPQFAFGDETTAPITLNPDQGQAMLDAANSQNGDDSVLQKAADFVTDNAPFFIIGIIVLAAILVGILIVRGRSRDRAGSPEMSAAERRRHKRVEIQRAREEERLRRRNRQTARRSPAGTSLPSGVVYSGDPARAAIEAEKRGSVDQGRAAAAVARSMGPVAAPFSPTQTAPALGVITDPVGDFPPPAAPLSSADPATPAFSEPPTSTLDLPQPPTTPEPSLPMAPEPSPPMMPEPSPAMAPEPSLEHPGADATVGRNAAAFAAAAGTGALAASIGSADRSTEPPLPPAMPDDLAPPAAELAGSSGPVIDDRLRSTLDELRGNMPPAAPVERPDLSVDAPAIRSEDTGLSLGLAAVERQLSAERESRDRTLQDAEERLRRIEQQAEDAERRAAFAERLTQLKLEESEREKRLEKVISGIERAERRAEDAERRARSAERSAAAALEGRSAPARTAEPVEDPAPPRPPVATPKPVEATPKPVADPEPRTDGLGTSEPEPDETPVESASADAVNLNEATFEELRSLGLSVTQATRILAYRERFGGYESLEDLDRVPGFSPEKIDSMRSRFVV